MNAGVEIILERIKTHPEEFCTKGGGRIANGKWSRVIDNYSQHLNKEDYDAIKNAIDKVQQDNFTEEVMTILMDGRDKAMDEESELERITRSLNKSRVRMTSPDGSTDRIVVDKSQEWQDLISQGWTDSRRMRTSASVTLSSGNSNATWATPTITIPPTK